MNPAVIGLIAFACMFIGILTGIGVSASLPDHHLSNDSRDTVKLGAGLIATMTALVLGLVTASAKSSFDGLDKNLKQSAADILTLDRLLARFGPDTAEIRETLKQAVKHRVEVTWSNQASAGPNIANLEVTRNAEKLIHQIYALAPQDDYQRKLQARAVELGETVLQSRWEVYSSSGSSVARPFLAVLIFWLTIIFSSFGLFAPRNSTVFIVLVVCAISVASAIFLILELDGPFDGLIQVSADPLLHVHEQLNR